MSFKRDDGLIVALDFVDFQQTINFAKRLSPSNCKLKVGSVLFTLYGPKIVDKLIAMGFDVFLDLKFHDIPNTVALACKAACSLGVWMLTIHISSGEKALKDSVSEIQKNSKHIPLVVGVSVLTSLACQDAPFFFNESQFNSVIYNMGDLAVRSGLNGIVCSVEEVGFLKKHFSNNLMYVTPGIRMSVCSYDQKRVKTPYEAIVHGADYLVIGREITESNDPLATVNKILFDIEKARNSDQ